MEKTPPGEQLDNIDLSILQHLQQDGRLSNARLAEKLALSETPCWRRLKRLESEGYIAGYQANLSRRKLGYKVMAYVQLSFASHTDGQLDQFEQRIQAIPEILSCHNVSGEADYMLQVVASDLEAYGQFVSEVLRKLPGVTAIRSSLALREIKAVNHLPLPDSTRSSLR